MAIEKRRLESVGGAGTGRQNLCAAGSMRESRAPFTVAFRRVAGALR